MGILDIFNTKDPLKLKAKIVQKYGDASVRQGALRQLVDMPSEVATAVLLERMTVTVEPQTTDSDEKDYVFKSIVARGEKAVAQICEFLRNKDVASSWALRMLKEIQSEEDYKKTLLDVLEKLGSTYTRDTERKQVLIHALEGIKDERAGQVVLPFLEDLSDEIKIQALQTLGVLKYENAREPILKLLTNEETAKRVRTASLAALADAGLGVQGYREKVEALLQEPYFIDKAGILKRKG